MSRIYALSSVKLPGYKLRLCKKRDKYEVWDKDATRIKMQQGKGYNDDKGVTRKICNKDKDLMRIKMK